MPLVNFHTMFVLKYSIRHYFYTAYLLNKTETSIATGYIRVVLQIRVHISEDSSGLLTGSDIQVS